ncbi:MAG: hypothetical protein WKF75_03325 [Singulisphaera sp.]
MIDEGAIADDLIPGRSKRSSSYHRDYGGKTYREIKILAGVKPPDLKARQMKKLIEQVERLRQKARRRRS